MRKSNTKLLFIIIVFVFGIFYLKSGDRHSQNKHVPNKNELLEKAILFATSSIGVQRQIKADLEEPTKTSNIVISNSVVEKASSHITYQPSKRTSPRHLESSSTKNYNIPKFQSSIVISFI